MRAPVPFTLRAPHHGYIGLVLIILAWTMQPYSYYSGIWPVFETVGTIILADDVVEHTVIGDTPLRILFEKLIIPFVERIRQK